LYQLAEYTGHQDRVRSAVFDSAGTRVATASSDETARIWSLDGSQSKVLEGHRDGVLSVEFSPDGRLLLTGSADGDSRLWNSDGETICVLPHPSGWVRSATFSPDGKRVLTAASDGVVRIWRVRAGAAEVLRTLEMLPDDSFLFWRGEREALINGSKGFWRWLGWSGFTSDRATVLPSESFGPIRLPAATGAAAP
jgi:WD40 repeat protein